MSREVPIAIVFEQAEALVSRGNQKVGVTVALDVDGVTVTDPTPQTRTVRSDESVEFAWPAQALAAGDDPAVAEAIWTEVMALRGESV